MSEQEEEQEEEQDRNKVAKNLKGLGTLIIIAGIFGALVLFGLANDSGYNSYSDAEQTTFRISAIVSIVSGITSGSLFIGISEIINQLFQLNIKEHS